MAKIIVAYQNGKTTYELADEYGCDRNTISNNLKRHGITVFKNKATAKLDVEQVLSLYASKYTAKQIAEQFQVSPTTIQCLLRKHGVKLRGRWDY